MNESKICDVEELEFVSTYIYICMNVVYNCYSSSNITIVLLVVVALKYCCSNQHRYITYMLQMQQYYYYPISVVHRNNVDV